MTATLGLPIVSLARAGVRSSACSRNRLAFGAIRPTQRALAQRSWLHSSASRSSDVRPATPKPDIAAAEESIVLPPTRPGDSKKGGELPPHVLALYDGPLTKMFLRCKMFSLSTLLFAVGGSPFLLFAPGEVALTGRLAITGTALAASTASTALFAYMGNPYVKMMRLLDGVATQHEYQIDSNATSVLGKPSSAPAVEDGAKHIVVDKQRTALQMLTTTWRLQALKTTIYEPGLLRPTSRPLCSWELSATPPPLSNEEVQQHGATYPIVKLVAATRTVKGEQLTGRWWCTWHAPGQPGTCTQEGRFLRHYNVNESMLGEDWKML